MRCAAIGGESEAYHKEEAVLADDDNCRVTKMTTKARIVPTASGGLTGYWEERGRAQ